MSARQKGIVQGRITDGTLFPGISMAISTAMAAVVQGAEDGLRADVAAVLGRVEADAELTLKGRRKPVATAASGRNTISITGSGIQRERVAAESAALAAMGDEVEKLWQRHASLVQSVSAAE